MQLGRTVRGIWGIWLVSGVLFFSRPTAWRQVAIASAALLMIGLLVVASVWVAVGWKKRGWGAALVPVVSIALTLVAPAAGLGMRNWTFRWDLPRYERAAKWAGQQTLTPKLRVLELPEEYEGLAYTVQASRSADCGTAVQFYWGGAFPVKHWARAYFSADSADRTDCRGEWNRGRRLTEHWYELVD